MDDISWRVSPRVSAALRPSGGAGAGATPIGAGVTEARGVIGRQLVFGRSLGEARVGGAAERRGREPRRGACDERGSR